MEERDLFDMFRESSEHIAEQPTRDSWHRLERRLTAAAHERKRLKRRPMPLQLMAVAATVALLAIIGVVSWVVSRTHESRLKREKAFTSLQFLVGEWSDSEGKMSDKLIFEIPDSGLLRGVKTLEFAGIPGKTDTFLLKNTPKQTVFIYQNQTYMLQKTDSLDFLFMAQDSSTIHLRHSSDTRFTLSFGEGRIFTYKKNAL